LRCQKESVPDMTVAMEQPAQVPSAENPAAIGPARVGPVRVGIVGLGTVGSGVVRILHDSAEHLRRHVGRPIEVAAAIVRDVGRDRGLPLARDRICSDLARITEDPGISVAVLVVGGLEPARSMIVSLLEAGKDVVTANKAVLAEHGPELFGLARSLGRSIAFEAAVAGGIPVVAAIGECLAANRIESIRGILNGTSNFILTRMEEDGSDYRDALALAQQKGFAEADPAMDVDGTDATQKLALLAHLAFGTWIPWGGIPRAGIESLDADLLRYAGELGYRVRLVAFARRDDDGCVMRVGPALVRVGTPLAETRGAYNAVGIVGDAVGRVFFHGLGAGQMPTASAVVADIIDTVVGRAAITFRTTGVLDAESPPPALSVDPSIRHFLRIRVADRPGVLARIAGILGDHGVSIASVIQHDPTAGDGSTAPTRRQAAEAASAAGAADGVGRAMRHSDDWVSLVIMTRAGGRIAEAVARIDACDVVAGSTACFPVLDD
jgi:homoserine dehydrogenase